MALKDDQRDQGLRGIAAARRAGRIADEANPVEVRLPFAEPQFGDEITAEMIAEDLLDQARRLLGLSNRQIADRTDLTIDLLVEIDAGRFAVTLEELIIALADLGLHVELVAAPPRSGDAPLPDQPPTVQSPLTARLPYRDD